VSQSIIPLSPVNQTFGVPLEEKSVQMTIIFNERMGVYTLTMVDVKTSAEIISGMPIVGGVDIFRSYALQLGTLFVFDQTGEGVDPDKAAIGVTSQMVIFSESEFKS
jgi:hypothetical protein